MYKFCYIGRVVIRQKRCDLLKDFVDDLNKNNIKFTLNIFGRGDAELEDALVEMENVKLFGHVEHWVDHVTEEYIFISFSDYEGCPLSLLEFKKYVGNQMLVKNSNGLKQYVSSNCLFDTVPSLLAKLQSEVSLENTLDLSTYFENSVSKKQLQEFENDIF